MEYDNNDTCLTLACVWYYQPRQVMTKLVDGMCGQQRCSLISVSVVTYPDSMIAQLAKSKLRLDRTCSATETVSLCS